MENEEKMANNAKKPNSKILLILGIAIIVILVVIALVVNKSEETSSQVPGGTETETEEVVGPEGLEDFEPMEMTETESGQLIPEGSRVEIDGANPIIENTVVTLTGEATKNDVVPMSPEAPQQTGPISRDELPGSVIKVEASASGFSPSSFTVKAGAPVTMAISSVDNITHVFMFDDPQLMAVAIGVGPNETRAITFNAPSEKGEYSFRCDVPGHSGRGEIGSMIVE
ncbi:MAG: cupredoxin domain-containing protein [Patescibacteria group bacterium]|jgi:plastocyanin